MDLGTIWASCISLHFPFWGQHNSELACAFQPRCGETSPMVRWFRHFHCRRPGSNPGQASKDPTCGNEHEICLCTATKTWYSQINNWINIFFKVCAFRGSPQRSSSLEPRCRNQNLLEQDPGIGLWIGICGQLYFLNIVWLLRLEHKRWCCF